MPTFDILTLDDIPDPTPDPKCCDTCGLPIRIAYEYGDKLLCGMCHNAAKKSEE